MEVKLNTSSSFVQVRIRRKKQKTKSLCFLQPLNFFFVFHTFVSIVRVYKVLHHSKTKISIIKVDSRRIYFIEVIKST